MGYGLLLCEDGAARVTLVGDDPDWVRLLRQARRESHEFGDVTVPADKFPRQVAGWPDDWVEPPPVAG